MKTAPRTKKIYFILIGILVCIHIQAQELLRYVDGEAAEVLIDWRLKQSKVNDFGFDYFSKSSNGTPLAPILGNDSYKGNHCIIYEVNSSSEKERIEHKFANIDDIDALTFNTARYFGFALKMDGLRFDDLTSSLIFWQAWQGPPYNPPVSLKFMTQKNSSGEYRVKLAIRNDDTGALGGTEIDAGSYYIAKNLWHTFQIYFKPRHANFNGEIVVWINGIQKMSYIGKIGYTPDPPVDKFDEDFKYDGLVCKWGIYQPNANTGHRLFFDEIKYGNSFNAVLPSTPTIIKETNLNNYKIQNNKLKLSNSASLIEIYNINGMLILKKENVGIVDLNFIKSGIYIIVIDGIAHKIII